MLKLFHNPDSRSSRFIWLLEELGVDYELVYVDIPRWSGKGAPDSGNPHPDKRVPALMHDDQLVTESAAIALYLTDAFPLAGLGPRVGDSGRAAYLTWLAFYAGEMELAFGMQRRGWTSRDPHRQLEKDHGRIQRRVLAALSQGPYIMGQRFTAADIMVSSPYQWVRDFGPPSPLIDDWLARLAARPAAIRGAARDERNASR
ncbi:MAG TPA: glutathione S-transferase family protein [Steroidobacteraceae bacterium]|jgi:glutathione S-transferase